MDLNQTEYDVRLFWTGWRVFQDALTQLKSSAPSAAADAARALDAFARPAEACLVSVEQVPRRDGVGAPVTSEAALRGQVLLGAAAAFVALRFRPSPGCDPLGSANDRRTDLREIREADRTFVEASRGEE